MVLAVVKFTAVLLILKYLPLRLALTPARDQAAAGSAAGDRGVQGRGRAPHRRPHRRADLSVDGRASRRNRRRRSDHRGHRRRDLWGEAMAALHHRGPRRPSRRRACVAAIEQVGAVLAEHFPRTAADTNEIPDKLIDPVSERDDDPPKVMWDGQIYPRDAAGTVGIYQPDARHPRRRHPRRSRRQDDPDRPAAGADRQALPRASGRPGRRRGRSGDGRGHRDQGA